MIHNTKLQSSASQSKLFSPEFAQEDSITVGNNGKWDIYEDVQTFLLPQSP